MGIDITYSTTGMFTRFFAESDAGIIAFNDLARQNDGSGTIYTMHLDATLKTMRSAGYRVKKQHLKPMTKLDMAESEDLLLELGI